MADRGLALLDADSLLMVIEERGELRVAASAGAGTPRLRITPVEGSALGALYRAGEPVAVDRPRRQEAAWLHELGLEARAALVEPLLQRRERQASDAPRWMRLSALVMFAGSHAVWRTSVRRGPVSVRGPLHRLCPLPDTTRSFFSSDRNPAPEGPS